MASLRDYQWRCRSNNDGLQAKIKQGAKTPCSFSLNNFPLYEMPRKNHVVAIHELPLQVENCTLT